MAEKIDPYLWYAKEESNRKFVSACDYSGFDVTKAIEDSSPWKEWHRQPDGRLSKNLRRRKQMAVESLIADLRRSK